MRFRLLAVDVVVAAPMACAFLALRLGFEAIIKTHSAPSTRTGDSRAGGFPANRPTRRDRPMLTNKWIQFGLSAAIAFAGVAVGFDWSSVVGPRAAGVVVAALGGLKMVLNAMAPPPGAQVVPTDGALITHKAA